MGNKSTKLIWGSSQLFPSNQFLLAAAAVLATYGWPPCLLQASSNSCSSISAPLLRARPVSCKLSSHMSRSSFPATRRRGTFSGRSSSCLATHWPLKWAYHQPFFLFSLSLLEGEANGTRKYLWGGLCLSSALLLLLLALAEDSLGGTGGDCDSATRRRAAYVHCHSSQKEAGIICL